MAGRKLPNRLRTVRSAGLIPAAVHESAVGNLPVSVMNRRIASRISSSLSEATLATQTSGLRTRGGFGLWNLGPPPSGVEQLEAHDWPWQRGVAVRLM